MTSPQRPHASAIAKGRRLTAFQNDNKKTSQRCASGPLRRSPLPWAVPGGRAGRWRKREYFAGKGEGTRAWAAAGAWVEAPLDACPAAAALTWHEGDAAVVLDKLPQGARGGQAAALSPAALRPRCWPGVAYPGDGRLQEAAAQAARAAEARRAAAAACNDWGWSMRAPHPLRGALGTP